MDSLTKGVEKLNALVSASKGQAELAALMEVASTVLEASVIAVDNFGHLVGGHWKDDVVCVKLEDTESGEMLKLSVCSF